MELQCARCCSPLALPSVRSAFTCQSCGTAYYGGAGFLRYKFDDWLFERFGEQYLRNRVLNNNAEIAYRNESVGSLSTGDREDVTKFAIYVAGHSHQGRVLDVGCGILPLPGYLSMVAQRGDELLGLDPMDSDAFQGFRIVGCSEYIPLPDASLDTVIFGTSLDHVCDIDATMRETRRVLRKGGRVIIWMGDKSQSIARGIMVWARQRIKSLIKGYPTYRYTLLPNGTVMYVPPWAADAFHSYKESPDDVTRRMGRADFRLVDMDYQGRDQVFLCFEAE